MSSLFIHVAKMAINRFMPKVHLGMGVSQHSGFAIEIPVGLSVATSVKMFRVNHFF